MLQVLEKTRLRVSIICQFSLEDSAKGELSPVGTARNVKETRIKKCGRMNGTKTVRVKVLLFRRY